MKQKQRPIKQNPRPLPPLFVARFCLFFPSPLPGPPTMEWKWNCINNHCTATQRKGCLLNASFHHSYSDSRPNFHFKQVQFRRISETPISNPESDVFRLLSVPITSYQEGGSEPKPYVISSFWGPQHLAGVL